MVLTVSGVILSLAAPRYERLVARLEMNGALNTIVSDLYYARMLAVREGRHVSVRFQRIATSPRCYGAQYRIVVVETPERVVKRQDLGAAAVRGCLDVGAVDHVRFGPRGLPNGAMNRTVSIRRGEARAGFRMSRVGRVYRDQ